MSDCLDTTVASYVVVDEDSQLSVSLSPFWTPRRVTEILHARIGVEAFLGPQFQRGRRGRPLEVLPRRSSSESLRCRRRLASERLENGGRRSSGLLSSSRGGHGEGIALPTGAPDIFLKDIES